MKDTLYVEIERVTVHEVTPVRASPGECPATFEETVRIPSRWGRQRKKRDDATHLTDRKQHATITRIPTANNGVDEIVCDLAVSARNVDGDDEDRHTSKPMDCQVVLGPESSQRF